MDDDKRAGLGTIVVLLGTVALYATMGVYLLFSSIDACGILQFSNALFENIPPWTLIKATLSCH